MTTAISTFGGAVVTFLKAVDAGGNTDCRGRRPPGQPGPVRRLGRGLEHRPDRAVIDSDRDVNFAQLRSLVHRGGRDGRLRGGLSTNRRGTDAGPDRHGSPGRRRRVQGLYSRVGSMTMPRPAQVGQVAEKASTSPSDTRLRVISTRPSSEMSKTWVRVLSRARASLKQPQHVVAVAPDLHVDEVDDDDAADVAQAQLAGDLLGRLQVVAVDGLLQVGAAHVLAGVDVDDGEGLGALDDERPARRQPHLAVEGLVELLVDVLALEEGQDGRLLVELDAVDQLGDEGGHVVVDLARSSTGSSMTTPR